MANVDKTQHVVEVVCQVGEHQHQLAHQCSLCENFPHTNKV